MPKQYRLIDGIVISFSLRCAGRLHSKCGENSTPTSLQFTEKWFKNGMVLSRYSLSESNMKDIFSLLTALILGYICFMGVVFFVGKLIFPFLTKEELKKRNIDLKRRTTLLSER